MKSTSLGFIIIHDFVPSQLTHSYSQSDNAAFKNETLKSKHKESLNGKLSRAAISQNSTSQSISVESSPHGQPLKLLLNDINDIINMLEYEAIGAMGFHETFAATNNKVEEILINLSAPLDKLTKLIRLRHESTLEGIVVVERVLHR